MQCTLPFPVEWTSKNPFCLRWTLTQFKDQSLQQSWNRSKTGLVFSSNFVLSDGMYEILAAPSGRVLKYDVATNTSKVIMDNLSFANGIVLSPNEDFILVRT